VSHTLDHQDATAPILEYVGVCRSWPCRKTGLNQNVKSQEIGSIIEKLLQETLSYSNSKCEKTGLDQIESIHSTFNETEDYIQSKNKAILAQGSARETDLNHAKTNVPIYSSPYLLTLKDISKILDDLIESITPTNIITEKHREENLAIVKAARNDSIKSPLDPSVTPSLFHPKKTKLMTKNIVKKFNRKSVEFQVEFGEKNSIPEHQVENNPCKPTSHISYQDVEPLKRRKTNNISYQSTDHAEKKDIESNGWDKIKHLKSDQEYINHAQQKLGNREISDPCQCMSYHGYRRSILANGNPDLLKLRAKNYANSKRIDMRSKLVLKVRYGKMETVKYELNQNNSI